MKTSRVWRKLRKFGLGYCDLPTMMWNISVILRLLTLNIDSRYRKRIPKVLYLLLILCIVNYFYVYLFSMLWFVFVRSPQTGDLVAAMVVLSLGVCSETTFIKLFVLLGSAKKLRYMVDCYLECDSLVIPGSRFHGTLMKHLRVVKLRAVSYWSIIIFNSLAYISTPAFMEGRHLLEDLYVVYGLEPKYESPNYELTNFFMSVAVVFVCYTTASIAAFFIIAVGYIEAQLLALSKELLHVWEDSTKQYYKTVELKIKVTYPLYRNILDAKAKKNINSEVKKRLVQIIKLHAKNVSLLRQIEYIFRETIALSFLFLLTGLIAELLGGLDSTYLQVPFTFSQVLMDCFTGQKLIDASDYLERAIYDCKWEEFDVNNKKIVLVMLQNGQKTLNLSAGGMTVLSFATIGTVIRTVYSSYTTLRSMMK